MDTKEMIMLFETLLQQASPEFEIKLKPDSFTILEFLNLALDQYIDLIYTGRAPLSASFEQDQLTTDNLRELVTEATLALAAGGPTDKPNSYKATIPADYLYTVGEEVDLEFQDPENTTINLRTGVTESTSDTYTRQVHDPYSEHVLHYEKAKPLRLYKEDSIELITDGNYIINNYYLRYIKQPSRIELDGADYTDLPLNVQKEVVNFASKLFLSSFGNSNQESQ